jgi:peptide/nickel transport system ATP-binding protein
MSSASAILEVRHVTQRYALRRSRLLERRPVLTALDAVDFTVSPGEAVGLVGESGSGKTTLAKILTGAEPPTSGEVIYHGSNVWTSQRKHRDRFRRSVQVVLQNPRSSFDPRMRIGLALLEPLRSLGMQGDHATRVHEVLRQVGMDRAALTRFPHEFSGGQLQRLAIARALMPAPEVLIADEPVSSLDVSIQAQVLNLLKDLVHDLRLALVLVAHDLSVVAYTTGRVAVMAAGRIVEVGPPRGLFADPQADATRNLVNAVLSVEAGLAGGALD